jgi:hypothetical protein
MDGRLFPKKIKYSGITIIKNLLGDKTFLMGTETARVRETWATNV